MQYTLHSDTEHRLSARVDANTRNENIKQLYLPVEITRADTAMRNIKACYESTEFFTNYRKNFIALKVSKPYSVRDRDALQQLEQAFNERNYQKVVTPQGIIYRIPKIWHVRNPLYGSRRI